MLVTLSAAVGACGPIGVLQSHVVEAGAGSLSALDGHVALSAPEGATEGAPRVGFRRGPLPADRPMPPGIVTVGDMVTMEVDGGAISRARIAIDYGDLPVGVAPEMLNVFAWSADLGGWVPLTGTVTDAVERAVVGDTALFDSFVLGTWRLTSDGVTGDAITTGAGTVLPIKEGTGRAFWAYARSAASSSLRATVEHLTGTLLPAPVPSPAASTPPVAGTPLTSTPGGTDKTVSAVPSTPAPTLPGPVAAIPDALVCEPRATNATVQVTSTPAGRFDACVVSGTASQQLRVRNRYRFPLVLQLPTGGRVKPVLDTAVTAEPAGAVDGIRNTVLTYLTGAIAIGGGQTVTLELQPGNQGPLRLTGHLDWSVIALDSGLRQLDLLLPGSRVMRPGTADALLQAHAGFGPAAVGALSAGEISPAVRALTQNAGLAGSERSVADLFQFSACVLKRAEDVAGADTDVLAGLKTAGPTMVVFTSDCLSLIYEKYLPAGSRSASGVLDTLKATTSAVRRAVPKSDRRRGSGQVVVTITPR